MSANGHKQTLARTVRRLAQPPLFGRRNFKLDGRQLLRGHADALQERQPARVQLDVGEQGFGCNLSQARGVVGHRLVQPLEGPVADLWGKSNANQEIGDHLGLVCVCPEFDRRICRHSR